MPAVFVLSAVRARAAAERTSLLKIISGGQTGVDRGALDAALQFGVDSGGWCPAGRLAEDGRIPDRYPVVELRDGGYPERTARNVTDADGTLIVTHGPSIGGTYETIQRCIEMQKPHAVIDCQSVSLKEAIEQAVKFMRELSLRVAETMPVRLRRRSVGQDPSRSLAVAIVLNVAGPRASQWRQGHDVAQKIVSALFERFSGHEGADE